MFRWVGIAAAVATLAACTDTGRLAPLAEGPRAPVGTPVMKDSVDGLIVGHRLMAAGEYELALKAYRRAALDQGLTIDVISAMGSANLRLGRLGQAERMLETAVSKDPDFVPALNNLGVVLMERGETARAAEIFRRAFALDDGNSEQIRQNLSLALAKLENPAYDAGSNNNFELVRRGNGRYLLLGAPDSGI